MQAYEADWASRVVVPSDLPRDLVVGMARIVRDEMDVSRYSDCCRLRSFCSSKCFSL
jgi:hypothetical protein